MNTCNLDLNNGKLVISIKSLELLKETVFVIITISRLSNF